MPTAIAEWAKGGDFVDQSVREMVLRKVRRLRATGPLIPDLAGNGKVKIVGAYDNLASGKVDCLG
ncbi:hypothetical protein E8L99_11015 [Phreatobacter aquaticus]|uniref:Carbonic anhydrase n=1 Tax=Phreatobacter aquaticus TaxID=2570229 RepID=A0A4D7QH81_9HYPH|nr:hypothetical protein [Phreatobacter aquaticus]QCK86245.1 hypothetical protein E8L99_11015 [Phreatobacter aquaticus]